MYSERVVEYFKNPKFSGKLKKFNGYGEKGNMKCILPKEKIHINDHMINIEDISTEDRILTHEGVYKNIISKSNRKYGGKIIELKNKLGKLSLTNEHLVFAIKVPKKREYFDYKVKKTLIPAWYHVCDLEQRDIVLYPILKEIKDIRSIKLDIKKPKFDFSSKDLPKRIPINKDFLRLCGYFLAEGHISEGKCRNYITLSFHKDEIDYIKDVSNISKKLFNLEVKLRHEPDKNLTVVYLNSARLARFFKKLFNKGAKNKRIPHLFMTLPINKQKALLEGLWKGDGYISPYRARPCAGYSTISHQLIQQIKTLLLRQNIVCSIYTEEEKMEKGVKHQKCYRIHIGDKKSLRKIIKILKTIHVIKVKNSEKTHSWFDKNYFYTPLSGIKTYNYKGKVFNLEVNDSHSFTTEAFCVHNCGDKMEVFINVVDGKIKKIGYSTFGCVAAISASEALCRLAKGKKVDDALKISNKDILEHLGSPMPPEKMHCSVLGAEALHAAIKDYKKKH